MVTIPTYSINLTNQKVITKTHLSAAVILLGKSCLTILIIKTKRI